ncbi:hypothetical protein HT031_006355 [Scenedesmus sp. PABB004]|nr:hypothetical protein HT031_006355 [Scenedesmus sp. PABB004]
MLRRWSGLLLATSLLASQAATLAAAAAAAAAAAPYTAPGPCSWERVKRPVVMPENTGCKGPGQCALSTTLTLPRANASEASPDCPEGPVPIVVMFNGFQSPSAAYRDYASRLASHGYAVLQYDAAPLTITPDATELRFLAPLLEALRGSVAPAASRSTSSRSPGTAGARRGRAACVRAAGAGAGGRAARGARCAARPHAAAPPARPDRPRARRGGKLAALQLATNPSVRAAYLVDPVDNTMFSPESEQYPSAAKALAAAQPRRRAGVSGAGVVSLCNPADANYPRFVDALAPGSWLEVLPNATHLAFAGAGFGSLPICGKGALSAREATSITAATMLAWLQQERSGRPPPTIAREAAAETAAAAAAMFLQHNWTGSLALYATSPAQPLLGAPVKGVGRSSGAGRGGWLKAAAAARLRLAGGDDGAPALQLHLGDRLLLAGDLGDAALELLPGDVLALTPAAAQAPGEARVAFAFRFYDAADRASFVAALAALVRARAGAGRRAARPGPGGAAAAPAAEQLRAPPADPPADPAAIKALIKLTPPTPRRPARVPAAFVAQVEALWDEAAEEVASGGTGGAADEAAGA